MQETKFFCKKITDEVTSIKGVKFAYIFGSFVI
jgi:hypothetical protein